MVEIARSLRGFGAGFALAELGLERGGRRQLDVDGASADLHREGRDLIGLAGQALARLEREGLLVVRAGDLRRAAVISEQAARQDHVALVRADVLRDVPLVARREVVDR